MIESAFPGGSGGGLQGLTAGTGITVDNTNPDNPVISSTVVDTNDAAKVSSNDTTAGYLNGKLVAGSNVTLTENNNGGNETLTIAATVPVTSVNTKTGAVTLNATDVGAAATSHTHAATDITSGVMATARLGTGTANGTTFLAGDQTYKTPPYPVTSVNGSTGAVTVAAGDTTYPITVADAENTTSLVTVLSFVIPANGLADGEIIELDWMFEVNNQTGNTPGLTTQVYLNGVTANVATDTLSTFSTRNRYYKMFIIRRGSNLFVPRVNTGGTNDYLPTSTGNIWSSSSNAMANLSQYTTLSPTFTNSNTFSISMQWNIANAATWVRTYSVRATKPNGQYT